jgi:hypothetical protein
MSLQLWLSTSTETSDLAGEGFGWEKIPHAGTADSTAPSAIAVRLRSMPSAPGVTKRRKKNPAGEIPRVCTNIPLGN